MRPAANNFGQTDDLIRVPAYVILHDKTLRQLATLRPEDDAALAEISGLGAAKREHYGEELLELIAEWAE